jgi:hypothetical protein
MPDINHTWAVGHTKEALVRLCELAPFAYERLEHTLGARLASFASGGPWGESVQNERALRRALREAGFDATKIHGEISLIRRRAEGGS